jgi:hypothetical protein
MEALETTSLRISPDLLGGGGSGGKCGGRNGDLRASICGVCGLLAILKCRGDEVPELEAVPSELGVSVARRQLGSVELRPRFFGGDLGASTLTAGGADDVPKPGPVETGLCLELRVGDEDSLAMPGWLGRRKFEAGTSRPLEPRVSSNLDVSKELRGADGDEGRMEVPCNSFGFGETALGAAIVDCGWAICSNIPRRDDTGFWSAQLDLVLLTPSRDSRTHDGRAIKTLLVWIRHCCLVERPPSHLRSGLCINIKSR